MISVTVLTKNSEETIASCLKALERFDEVIILDSGSTDLTFDIVETFPNVKIHKTEFLGFGPLHNLAAEKATHSWILSVDSDEVLSDELALEILKTSLNSDSVYSFPFHNFYNGKHIKGCGWYPDRHIRLYNKTRTQFTTDHVHEKIIDEHLKKVSLKSPIRHYSYRSISDFLKKMDTYSTLFAKQYRGKRSSSLSKAFLHSFFAFFKSYILKKGFLDGFEGYIISKYNSQTAFYKYLKLAELNKADASVSSLSSHRKG